MPRKVSTAPAKYCTGRGDMLEKGVEREKEGEERKRWERKEDVEKRQNNQEMEGAPSKRDISTR